MYFSREIFLARPGKAKDLVKMFKQAIPHFEKAGDGKNMRVMTDNVITYKGYRDCVEGGRDF